MSVPEKGQFDWAMMKSGGNGYILTFAEEVKEKE